jgi:hypothetical protein
MNLVRILAPDCFGSLSGQVLVVRQCAKGDATDGAEQRGAHRATLLAWPATNRILLRKTHFHAPLHGHQGANFIAWSPCAKQGWRDCTQAGRERAD